MYREEGSLKTYSAFPPLQTNDESDRSVPPYRPSGMQMWDTWFQHHQGLLHAFYLQRPGADTVDNSKELHLGHAVSADMVSWTEQSPVLSPSASPSLDDLQNWTGCVVRNRDVFFMFYTMRSSTDFEPGAVQRIGLATSRDLVSWERHAGNPVLVPDPLHYASLNTELKGHRQIVDCRDFVVVAHPDGGWIGYFASRAPGSSLGGTAVIGCARSDDLISWRQLPPALRDTGFACLEVPDVFEIDDTWYMTCLTGNQYGNRGDYSEDVTRATIYATATRPEGPYSIDSHDNVLIGGDASCAYSCRTVEVDGERLAFAIDVSTIEADTLSTPKQVTKTDAGLRLAWSSHLSALRVKDLTDVLDPSPVAPTPFWELQSGEWTKVPGGFHGTASLGWQACGLRATGRDLEIGGVFDVDGTAGFVVRPDPGRSHSSGDLAVVVDPRRSRSYAAWLPDFEDIVAISSRFDPSSVHLRLVRRGTRIEFYVDDVLTLQFATPLLNLGEREVGLGLFVSDGRADVHALSAFALD